MSLTCAILLATFSTTLFDRVEKLLTEQRTLYCSSGLRKHICFPGIVDRECSKRISLNYLSIARYCKNIKRLEKSLSALGDLPERVLVGYPYQLLLLSHSFSSCCCASPSLTSRFTGTGLGRRTIRPPSFSIQTRRTSISSSSRSSDSSFSATWYPTRVSSYPFR